jgi:hypothetical protein
MTKIEVANARIPGPVIESVAELWDVNEEPSTVIEGCGLAEHLSRVYDWLKTTGLAS